MSRSAGAATCATCCSTASACVLVQAVHLCALSTTAATAAAAFDDAETGALEAACLSTSGIALSFVHRCRRRGCSDPGGKPGMHTLCRAHKQRLLCNCKAPCGCMCACRMSHRFVQDCQMCAIGMQLTCAWCWLQKGRQVWGTSHNVPSGWRLRKERPTEYVLATFHLQDASGGAGHWRVRTGMAGGSVTC
jgi:hypothetical protein